MNFQPRSQAKAWAVSIALHLLMVLLLAWLNLGVPDHDPSFSNAGGMALALGVPEGIPDSDPSASHAAEQTLEPSNSDPEPQPVTPKSPPVATQDLEEAPTVPVKSSPPAESKPMDPRVQRVLNRKNNEFQGSGPGASKGSETGSPDATGQTNGSGGFSASGDGLEYRGFDKDPDPEEFKILDARVDIPIEVDREGSVRVVGVPKSSKPLTAHQRRTLVEATQKARFKRSLSGKEIQRGVLQFELKIRSRS
jgi:hypothetical protein